MKEAKMYELPTSCPCGYKAKKNWIEMEVHYDKCSQFRSLIKNESTIKIKKGMFIVKSLDKFIPMIREQEALKKGSGYSVLESFKNEFTPDIYQLLKSCLDNPDKDHKIYLKYIK